MKSEIMKDMSSRIRECAALVGSGDKLARATSMSRRTLENYFIGSSEPSVSKIAAISDVSGVSLEWLIRGEGPMMRDNLLAGTGDGGEAQTGLAHSAMAVYVTLFEAQKLVKPETFEELTIAMWELEQQDPDGSDLENPILKKVQSILATALKS
jgi:transcriptional regulator with XRE-family HTH domain